LLAGWLGLVASYQAGVHHGLRLASGATVVLAMTALFALVWLGRSIGRSVVTANTRRMAEAGT
jgi:manganese/iron transport system permease protein